MNTELEKALQHYQSGYLRDAEKICSRLLETDSNHSDSLHLLGLICYQTGKSERATNLINKAIQNDPDNPSYYNSLGVAFTDQGKLDEAVTCFKKAIRLKPNFVEAHDNIGNVHMGQGKLHEALVSFQRAAEFGSKNPSAKHLLAALTGETTEGAPQEYVRSLFDQYSRGYDDHLLKKLECKVPKLLRGLLNSLVKGNVRFGNVLDLGCGSGLSGMEFRDISDLLIGVDLSPKMVEEARRKGIYDALYVGDMIEFLNGTDEKYDLLIAADVFVYVGNLRPVFSAVQDRLREGAYFVFSTESHYGSKYVLRKMGRYAHSKSYIESLARKHNLAVEVRSSKLIRKEKEKWIMGDLFVLRCGT
ncbi:MAG: class I SAM-dependent DNA methyltransferase [Planctomycetota bacterium]